MLDIQYIRMNPEIFDKHLDRRGILPMATKILEIDTQRRQIMTEHQLLLERRNELIKIKDPSKFTNDMRFESLQLKAKIPELNLKEKELTKEFNDLMASIPNIPDDDVPYGKNEDDNIVVRVVGDIPEIDNPKEHYELGENLKLMDFKSAASISGARFTVLSGDLARLERALGQFMLDLHITKHGYTEINPPFLVKDEALYGTGQLPKFSDDLFKTVHGHWMIPTAEVPLTNLVNNKILNTDEMPIRMVALTPCFRSEAGSAGKDSRGMIRQHQFMKVEMVSIITPDISNDEHLRMTECAETVLKMLKLPFRTVLLCSGDMGFSARKTYDIEVWMPGQKMYREISSCSNCGDFQARRMKARYRDRGTMDQTQFVHTLNGSGVAVGRCLIAIMENYQQPDGSIIIPDVLIPYMGGNHIIGDKRVDS